MMRHPFFLQDESQQALAGRLAEVEKQHWLLRSGSGRRLRLRRRSAKLLLAIAGRLDRTVYVEKAEIYCRPFHASFSVTDGNHQ